MKIRYEGETLNISEIGELGLANSDGFRREVRAALAGDVRNIVIDLSSISFMDCTGLGALAALSGTARKSDRDISLYLVTPTPLVQRIARLTGLDSLFQSTQKAAEFAQAV
jgi:anti-sigma B factor antagonist